MKTKKQPEPTSFVGFSVQCNNADEPATYAGLLSLEGCEKVQMRSLQCRANGYDGWELTALFAYTPELAAQDGAKVYV